MLWAQAGKGDPSAFGALFERHSQRVYNHCFRLAQIEDITRVFESQGIETVSELRDRLGDPAKRTVLREALAAVRHVSPKTLDYIDTLSGISTAAAADEREIGE